MERDLTQLQIRLVREPDIKSQILLYAIFDCAIDNPLVLSGDLLKSNALELVNKKIAEYYNLSENPGGLSFKNALRSEQIMTRMKEFYETQSIPFDSEKFILNWPHSLEGIEKPWTYIDDMIRTKNMILKRMRTNNHEGQDLNSLIKINVIRHSAKGNDGQLTPEGKLAAKTFSMGTGTLPNLKIYTSGIPRAVDTGRIIAEETKATLTLRVKPILSEEPYSDERLEELGLSGGKWLLLNGETGELPSTNYMAGKIARFILDVRKTVGRVKCEPEIFAVSHIPPMMCFLGHIIAYTEGKETIDESIREKLFSIFENKFFKPLEGMEISVTFENIQINVRGRSFLVPMKLITDLSEAYKKTD